MPAGATLECSVSSSVAWLIGLSICRALLSTAAGACRQAGRQAGAGATNSGCRGECIYIHTYIQGLKVRRGIILLLAIFSFFPLFGRYIGRFVSVYKRDFHTLSWLGFFVYIC
jgi:hypothetical protein